MRNLFFWITIYALALASSQLLLKYGLYQIGAFNIKSIKDLLAILAVIIKNPYIIFGTLIMASTYFLWITILSWFKLSLAFPLTSIAFIFVAILSYFILNEKLLPHNYLGIAIITIGIFFLLYKQ
ncbi:MAG: EamA family transporter [Candidatus Margulisbacteria bacterium]|nr:EamA family transporter [Candidatus Margulisiibacteriota bacterium]MBU1022138.1 EamA family transporter [Candidatus Margulisiibacteriota bacterium]MBU1729423.1 EamA family transporter [Candidatus Margulisiibacteriota bacterium]MBU1955696.1 EamA family transporter [Candidatus Margulisiibacteriota bacterium]